METNLLRSFVYSTKIHDALPAALTDSIHVPALLNDLLSHPEACEHDAILLVDQPGVRTSVYTLLPQLIRVRSMPTTSAPWRATRLSQGMSRSRGRRPNIPTLLHTARPTFTASPKPYPHSATRAC